MPLVPSTPPGTPALAPSSSAGRQLTSLRAFLSARVGAGLRLVVEAQDPSGLVSVAAFLGSAACSAASLLALHFALAGNVAYYPAAAWVARHAGRALWGLAVGAGFWSQRTLPKVLAWSIVLEAVVFYSWDRLGLAGGFYPWNFYIHIGLAAVVAVPAALAQVRRWLGRNTA